MPFLNTLQIQIESKKPYVRLIVNGSFLASGFGALRSAISSQIDSSDWEAGYLVLDLTNVGLLTSACLDALNAERRHADSREWSLIVITPREDVKDLFELTGTNRFIPLYSDYETFLSSRDSCTSGINKG